MHAKNDGPILVQSSYEINDLIDVLSWLSKVKKVFDTFIGFTLSYKKRYCVYANEREEEVCTKMDIVPFDVDCVDVYFNYYWAQHTYHIFCFVNISLIRNFAMWKP